MLSRFYGSSPHGWCSSRTHILLFGKGWRNYISLGYVVYETALCACPGVIVVIEAFLLIKYGVASVAIPYDSVHLATGVSCLVSEKHLPALRAYPGAVVKLETGLIVQHRAAVRAVIKLSLRLLFRVFLLLNPPEEEIAEEENKELGPEEELNKFLGEHSEVTNLFKMLKMGVPVIGVMQKAQLNQFDMDVVNELIDKAKKVYPSIQ